MAESTRERILEAACELIASDGIDDVRIARVAMRAGVSTGLVHHHFSTREELLEQALVHSFEQAGDQRFREAAAGGTATEALALGLAECLPFPGVQERQWVLWVELWLRAVREPALRPVATRLYAEYREWMENLIAAGIASGEFELRAGADHRRHRRPGDGAARRRRRKSPARRPGDGRRARPRARGRRASPPSSASSPRRSRPLSPAEI